MQSRGRTATLRASEWAYAASDFSQGWSQCGQQEAGDLDIWELQARFTGKRGLRSPLLSWLDSDLVVQEGVKRKRATIKAMALCVGAQASTGRLPRITLHKASLGPRKALCSSFLQAVQCFKYDGSLKVASASPGENSGTQNEARGH